MKQTYPKTPFCEVTGIQMNTAHEPIKKDTVRIKPSKGAVLNGIHFSQAPFTVISDENGRWSTKLLPSKYAGFYKITFSDGTTVEIDVPENKTKAPYTELVTNA